MVIWTLKIKVSVPEDSVPFTMCNVDVLCEQDGVVRHHRVTGRQNASCCVTNDVQDAVIHQEVVHQQLHTDTMEVKVQM